MNALVFHLLTVLVSAGPPPAPQDALLTNLVEKGVEMPDGQFVRLPPPTMAEGLNAAQQAEVLAKIAAGTPPRGKVTVAEFLKKESNAPVSLKLARTDSKKPAVAGKDPDLIRTVDLHFVVYGDWNVLTSDDFSKTILKEGKGNNAKNGSMVSRAGFLKPAELAVRRLVPAAKANLKECYLYTTFNLFDRAEVSATRFCAATKTPAGVIVAAKVDPQFGKDKEYANHWRTIDRNAAGMIEMGAPQPYSGAAFYAKVTRLIKPANAIFVEFHQVFYEPYGWFEVDRNLMPSQLRKIIPFEVKEFRGKVARATLEAAKTQKKPADMAEKKPDAETK
jgi:hypothetical protein